jgi:hypothetical protein
MTDICKAAEQGNAERPSAENIGPQKPLSSGAAVKQFH